MARPKNCNRCNKPKRPRGKQFKELPGYCECGRPTVLTPEVLQKLEDSFSNGLNNSEACFYAGIAESTFYNFTKEKPEMMERFKGFRMRPQIKAKQTVAQSLGDPVNAWKYLEKRDPDFKPTQKIEHSGSVEITATNENMSDGEKAALITLRQERRKRIEAESDKLA